MKTLVLVFIALSITACGAINPTKAIKAPNPIVGPVYSSFGTYTIDNSTVNFTMPNGQIRFNTVIADKDSLVKITFDNNTAELVMYNWHGGGYPAWMPVWAHTDYLVNGVKVFHCYISGCDANYLTAYQFYYDNQKFQKVSKVEAINWTSGGVGVSFTIEPMP